MEDIDIFNLEDFPEEVLWKILFHLDLSSLSMTCSVSTRFYKICQSNTFWNQKAQYNFNITSTEFRDTQLSGRNRYIQLGTKYGQVYVGSEQFEKLRELCYRAAKKNYLELLEYFLNKPGVNDNSTHYGVNRGDNTILGHAIMGAAESGYMELVQKLLAKAVLDDLDFAYEYAAEGAARGGYDNYAIELLNMRVQENPNILSMVFRGAGAGNNAKLIGKLEEIYPDSDEGIWFVRGIGRSRDPYLIKVFIDRYYNWFSTVIDQAIQDRSLEIIFPKIDLSESSIPKIDKSESSIGSKRIGIGGIMYPMNTEEIKALAYSATKAGYFAFSISLLNEDISLLGVILVGTRDYFQLYFRTRELDPPLVDKPIPTFKDFLIFLANKSYPNNLDTLTKFALLAGYDDLLLALLNNLDDEDIRQYIDGFLLEKRIDLVDYFISRNPIFLQDAIQASAFNGNLGQVLHFLESESDLSFPEIDNNVQLAINSAQRGKIFLEEFQHPTGEQEKLIRILESKLSQGLNK